MLELFLKITEILCEFDGESEIACLALKLDFEKKFPTLKIID